MSAVGCYTNRAPLTALKEPHLGGRGEISLVLFGIYDTSTLQRIACTLDHLNLMPDVLDLSARAELLRRGFR